MASVYSSRSRTYAVVGTDFEAPEHVQSDGELLVKQMVEKQLDTRLTLSEQLTHQKEFEKAIEFEPLTKYCSGQTTLKEFQESTTKVSRKEYLQSLGLTPEEIELVFDEEKGEEFLANKHKNIEKSRLLNRVKDINTKIKEAETKFAQKDEATLSCTGVSRHERELGLAVKPESAHTRLYQFALSCQPGTSDARPLSHPIHHLKDIEQELFGHVVKKRRGKRKPNLESKKSTIVSSVLTLPQVLPVQSSATTVLGTNSSMWDVKEVTPDPKKKSHIKVIEKKVYSCKPEVFYTIRNKKIVPLKDIRSTPKNVDGVSNYSGQPFVMANTESCDTNLTCERLTVAEIKALPKFSNYDRGIPSRVLYVKNLHKSLKEEDLVQLFRTFESPDEPRIVYRLMAGKMKGQAFITFNDIDRAAAAIDELNGCILKGQPVVIQFGKSTSQPVPS